MRSKVTHKTKSVIDDPKKFLFLLIPIISIFVIGLPLLGVNDTTEIFKWIMLIEIIGIATLPLTSFLWRNMKSGFFIFSQPLGILTVSLLVWTLTYLKIVRFTRLTVLIILIIIAITCYLIKPFRDSLSAKLCSSGVIEEIVKEQTLFSAILILLCYFKSFYPDINGQEKFMDYGFIMSMLRSSSLPANDMWLSGNSINYYYFGQYIYALLIKLLGMKPSIGYTIAMCTSIALPFIEAFAIGELLFETSEKNGVKCSKMMRSICGLLSALAVTIFGNSHSFFYDENSVGNGLLRFFSKLGINVGRTDNFYYPDSTRFIGYNPETIGVEGYANGGDATIEEFPFYSFLVGDLHAHVVSTMIVLLVIAILILFIGRLLESYKIPTKSTYDIGIPRLKEELASILLPETIVVSIILGITQMTNYWDFLIYFIFFSMALFVYFTRNTYEFTSVAGTISFILSVGTILIIYLISSSNPILHVILQFIVLLISCALNLYRPCALSRTSMGMSFAFTVSSLIALPFNFNFDMISNSLAACVNHSPLFQLYILWGTHVIICLTFVLMVALNKNYQKKSNGRSSRNASSATSLVIGPNSSEYPNPVMRFFGERNIVDIFVCGMIAVGILLLIAPEIFYVRDIYTSGYLRSNTMFKFTYAAFIILSLSMAYAISRLYWFTRKDGEFSYTALFLAIIFSILLLVPAHYTTVSLKQRSGDLSLENHKTLDGTEYIMNYQSPNLNSVSSSSLVDTMNVINYMNENIPGSPTIIEAYGDSYTDYNIISSYTGLPTVFGWQTHEWLWRFHGIVDEETNLLVSDPENDVWQNYISPRHNDIMLFYTSSNPDELRNIIDKYDISYLISGPFEIQKFGSDNSETIEAIGTLVYYSGDTKLYKVN